MYMILNPNPEKKPNPSKSYSLPCQLITEELHSCKKQIIFLLHFSLSPIILGWGFRFHHLIGICKGLFDNCFLRGPSRSLFFKPKGSLVSQLDFGGPSKGRPHFSVNNL